MISLLIHSRDPNSSNAYEQFLNLLNGMFEGGLDEANPIHTEIMSYKSFRKLVSDEKRYFFSVWSLSFLARLVEIITAVVIFKWGIPPLLFNSSNYRNSLRMHSDFRKFDGMLRMVIDCSSAQAEIIRQFLEEQCEEGRIFYGMHISDSALMTCYVQDLGDGGHMHFIDGGDGGYAMAAKQMKAQIKLT